MSDAPSPTNPQETEPDRILVFDGDCPVCERFTRLLVRIGWITDRERRAYQAFEGDVADALWNARIRNEMAVIEPATGAIRSGFDGLLWLFESTPARPLTLPFRFPPLRFVARLVYYLVAYNRRAIAPPVLPRADSSDGSGDRQTEETAVRCACDPDDHVGYQLGFSALIFSVVCAGWFVMERRVGGLLLSWFPTTPKSVDGFLPGLDDVTALEGILAWTATLIGFGITLPKGGRLRALPHMAVTCLLAITPALLVGPCLPLLPPALGRTLALCILIAVVVLPLRVWPPRARFLELDAGRSRAFAVPLACATLAGILFL